ncbi:MAG: hypothetical protein J6A54_02245 [Clostridia bacterium]|nr:hypothetical protein [Clostridia bacterium]
MKTLKKSLVAFTLALCMVLSLMACSIPATQPTESSSNEPNTTQVTGLAYLAIDINPSIELVLENGKVKGVNACNDDASVLLSGEDLSGLTADEATEKIVALAEELGYLNDENTGVKITATADDEDIIKALEEIAAEGAKKGSSRALVNSNPRLADEREVKELKDENPELYKNLSPAKLRLIKSIMEYDPDMTIEIGVEMSTEELVKLLKEYSEEYASMLGKELKEKFKNRKQELKAEAERRISEIYGEAHDNILTKLEALKTLYKEIKAEAEATVISDEDAEAILNLIGEESASVISNDEGEITVKSVEKYFDKAFDAELEKAKEELKAILDKYDEDLYALTEDDIAKITELCGETSVKVLADLEALIDATEAELKVVKDEANLDLIQQAVIQGIEEGFKDFENQIKEELKSDMESAKTHFEEQKQHRHDLHNEKNEAPSK